MRRVIPIPPYTDCVPVEETLHGVSIADPYRWLEDQQSPLTREWLSRQDEYARKYLDGVPGKKLIRRRVREFLEVDSYDSLEAAGHRYFFRKRLATQAQACICMREGPTGDDQILVDPARFGTGEHTSVSLIQVSRAGNLLLYEIKQGGERTGTFSLFDVERRQTLPDALPRGYLRGFAFGPDGTDCYYVHRPIETAKPFYRAVYRHTLNTSSKLDEEIFFAGDGNQIRLGLIADNHRLGILQYDQSDKLRTTFYLRPFGKDTGATAVLLGADYLFSPVLANSRLFALTDRNAPNFRIVELTVEQNGEFRWTDIVGEKDLRIDQWRVTSGRVYVLYSNRGGPSVSYFDLKNRSNEQIPVRAGGSLCFVGGPQNSELLFEWESFTEPASTFRCPQESDGPILWDAKRVPFDPHKYEHFEVSYRSKDGTEVPMFLMGRRDVLAEGAHPTIMTSYGGHGIAATPKFSVFVASLVEHGLLFALPRIRGGSDLGTEWHNQAKRTKRQTSFDDFIAAAEWLVASGRTRSDKLAIFGGSNSGLLVAAAMTQRPELFRAVLCMVPLTDMLRYHLFDGASAWQDEFGTAEDLDDFAALAAYSPYHHVYDNTEYPATLIVSGDRDGTCNPLHARKMTARLQAANRSEHPILLDYSRLRGHSPVLPLRDRIEALTDRIAFVLDQFEIEP
jgi:prolyl oligopeptidase